MPTVSYGIANTADDALTIPGSGNTDTGLLFGEIGGTSSIGAVRFLGVAISPTDTILSAEITFTRETVSQIGFSPISNGTNAGRLHGVKVANQGALPADLTTLTKTTASTTIVPGATVVVDVTTLAQEIQAVAGWASGNAMAFVGDPSTAPSLNYIEFYDRNRSSTLCAQLSITYTAGGPDVTPPTITSASTVSVAEGATLSHALTANETVTWSIVGGADASAFTLTGSTLSLPAQAFPSGPFVVVVRATDTAGNWTEQTITVSVTEAPPLSLVGSATGTTSAVIPAHQAGDLILCWAYRDGSNTLPTLPTGQDWTSLDGVTGANTNAARLVAKIADGSSETTGTFTSATSVVVAVYRPKPGYSATWGAVAAATGASTTVSYPAVSLQNTDGSSWVAGFAGHRSTNTALETPPTGMVNRATVVDGTDEAAAHDTNSGVSAWSATSVSVGGTSSGWRAATVEIRVSGPPAGRRPIRTFRWL